MKTVFKSNELAHVWAHKTAPRGRTPSNQSFDGPAYYSYSTVIARIIAHKGKEAFVVDNARFSSTTSGHQGNVRHAIRNLGKAFFVECGRRGQSLDFSAAELRDHYLDEFKTEPESSRYKHVNAERLRAKYAHLQSAIEVCEYFGLAKAKLTRTLLDKSKDLDEARKVCDAWNDKCRDRREFRWQHREEIRERNRQLQAERDKENIAKWIAGEKVQPSYNWPTYLRVEADEMVTSRGARVPIAEAEKAFRFAVIQRARGWHRNGEQYKIGDYDLDAVNEQGVVAGCHRVSWAEIERFAKQQGWM